MVAFAGKVVQDDSGVVGHVDIACYFRTKKNEEIAFEELGNTL